MIFVLYRTPLTVTIHHVPRPPSSTIAINRHAQFRPHRDSGAGNGQSNSLIVALGEHMSKLIVLLE